MPALPELGSANPESRTIRSAFVWIPGSLG
jgi:hypothetical protein